jgi:phosphatidylglycerol:prolipoprotein diacylglycerol transferase
MVEAALLTIKIGLDPTIVELGGLEITWHGVFTALGVIVGVAVAYAFARRAGMDEDTIYNAALALVVGGIVGARALYVIENWSQFEDDLGAIFEINTGGISIYGALIGGMVGAWLYLIVRKVPNIPGAADIAVMGGIIGMAVGRIGDVMNGEHFAETTSLPWGVQYTHPDNPSVLAGMFEAQHPAVAYELIGDVAIFLALVVIYNRVGRPGVTFFAFWFMYGALRLGVSFLRLDDIVWLGLRTAQLLAIATMGLSLAGIIYLLRTPFRQLGPSRAERRRLVKEEGAGEPSQGT